MFRRSSNNRNPHGKASQERHLTMEALEERDFLSVSPLNYASNAVEPDWFESLQVGEPNTNRINEAENVVENQWILQVSESVYSSLSSVSALSDYLSTQGITVISGLGSSGLLLAEVDGENHAGQGEILAGLDCLDYWQPNYLVTSNGVAQEINDPDVGLQWALDTIDVVSVWGSSDGSGVVVAVLDSGITLTHPDLKNNIWINTAEITGDGVDNDGNGFVDDVNGWNFVNGTANVVDTDGHGTHVAGIIGAVADNGIGGSGAAPGVKILPLKVISGSTGSTSTIVAAMNYLLKLKDSGVNITAANMSLGYYSEDVAVRQAIERAGQAGVVVVTSAGNNSKNNDTTQHYPSEYSQQLDNVISVASVDRYGQLASNSNYGIQSVDLAAPGVSIYSTTKNGGYGYMSGTSMAAPMVTAAVAMLSAYNPGLSPAEIRDLILDATVSLSSLSGKVATGGVLNLAGIFSADDTALPAAPTNLTLLTDTAGQTVLHWQSTSKNATGFEAQYSTDNGKTWTRLDADIPSENRSWTTTVGRGTLTLFRIRAVNGHGDSPWSNVVSTSTETLKKPAAPTGVKAKASGASEIVVSWKAASNATAYRVERALSTKGEWTEVYFGTDLTFTDTELDSSTKYYYRINAVNVSVLSSSSSTVSATTAAVLPASPTGISAVLVDAATIRVSWTAARHATNYRVEYYDTAKSRWTSVAKTDDTTLLHRNLKAVTTYQYRIVALSGAGESAPSVTVQKTTPIAVPTTPAGFKGSVVDAETVNLRWNASSTATSYRIEYSLTGKKNDWTVLRDNITSTEATIDGLSAGLKQYFRLVAVNESGDSAASTVYSVTTPALTPEGTPAAVTTEAESDTRVRIFWNAVKNATKYVIERSIDGSAWKKVKIVSAAETEALLSGHQSGTTYYYRVTATSPVGTSDPSSAVLVTTLLRTPSTPRLTVLGSDTVRIAWNAVKDASGYRIERALADSILWDTVAEVSADIKEFIDVTGEANTVYLYRIVALDHRLVIDSAPSKNKSICTAPVAPGGLRVDDLSGKTAALTWNESPGAVRYIVQRFDGTTWKNAGSSKTNEFTAKSLKSETDYRFRVIAVGANGRSEPGEEIGIRTAVDVPSVPGGLKVQAVDADTVTLSWKAAAGADSYRVLRYDTASKTWQVAGSATGLSYTDKGLDASTRYQYKVFAVNESGTSRRAATGNAVTLKASIGSLPPDGVELVSATKNVLKLVFKAPEAGRQTYRIQWSTDGTTWTSQKTATTSAATVVVNGLKSGTTYFIRIRLETGKNVSDWSETYDFSTI